MVSFFCSPAFPCPRATPPRFRDERPHIRRVPYSGKPAGRILRSPVLRLPDRRSLTRRCDTAVFADTPRASAPAIAAQCSTTFPQCRWMVRQVPCALPQWRSCHGCRGGYPRLLRGWPCPGARDGASVQFYISTVIRSGKIYQNVNFVVELSDTRI